MGTDVDEELAEMIRSMRVEKFQIIRDHERLAKVEYAHPNKMVLLVKRNNAFVKEV